MFKQYFEEIFNNRYILISLVNKDLIQKYRRSVLGVAWSIITPLGLAIMVGSVYSILFSTDPRILIPLLFAGINPWTFISGTADSGTISFIAAEGYIKQSTVSAQIFPLRTTMTNFVTLLYSILTYFSIYIFMEPNLFGPKMLMVFPGLIIVFIFTCGLANITSIITLNLRDFQPLQSIILQGLFYVTPIIYPVEIIAQKGGELVYKLNPFYYMLEVIRGPMIGKQLPGITEYLIAIAISIITFVISIIIVMKNKNTIAYKL